MKLFALVNTSNRLRNDDVLLKNYNLLIIINSMPNI
jgi:hypothetical protein